MSLNHTLAANYRLSLLMTCYCCRHGRDLYDCAIGLTYGGFSRILPWTCIPVVPTWQTALHRRVTRGRRRCCYRSQAAVECRTVVVRELLRVTALFACLGELNQCTRLMHPCHRCGKRSVHLWHHFLDAFAFCAASGTTGRESLRRRRLMRWCSQRWRMSLLIALWKHFGTKQRYF